ncbi:MAG: dihydrofolate reductase [Clostridiales bacterium]|nr:dihydrofolate reductase [Clostridiales bacterium]
MNTIVAVDEKWAIGKNNDLLFSIPEDMKYFRKMTLGAAVVYGKNNLLSFPGGKPLPKRRNIVISTSLELSEDYEVVRNLEELAGLLKAEKDREIFVIGGAEVYAQLLPYCSNAYVTKMFRDFKGEKFFPDLDKLPEWDLKEEGMLLDHEGLKYSFNIYENSDVKAFE